MNKIFLFVTAVTLLAGCYRHRNERVYVVEDPQYDRSERVYVEEGRSGRVYVKERPRYVVP